MAEVAQTWEEKLVKTQEVQKEREAALEALGTRRAQILVGENLGDTQASSSRRTWSVYRRPRRCAARAQVDRSSVMTATHRSLISSTWPKILWPMAACSG